MIAVNRALVLTIRDVKRARNDRRYDLHLKAGTPEEPQDDNTRCPSNNPYGIQCTCVDAGMSKNFQPSFGPNLIFSPPGLMASWGEHIKTHFHKGAENCNWEIRHAYGASGYNKYAAKLTVDDYNLMHPNVKSPYFTERNDSSNVLIFTTTGCFDNHVRNTFASTIPAVPARGRGSYRIPEKKDPWLVQWGRIIVDEVHKEHQPSTGTISRISTMNKESLGQLPRKIFISGTPFESTPQHMVPWIELIRNPTWDSAFTSGEQYPRMENHRRNLVHCTTALLRSLGKEHDRLVKAHINDKLNPEEYAAHKKNMTIVVQTLWLRRTGDSNFMGYKLAEIPPNYHYECFVTYPTKYHSIFEAAYNDVQKTVQEGYDRSVEKYKKRPSIKAPTIPDTTWLSAARRKRIQSSFPELAVIEATRDLKLTLDEIQDNKWIQTKPGKMYRLAHTRSPYETHIKEIAGPEVCEKMKVLEVLMANRWTKGAKLVVMAMGPVSALILYWVRIPIEHRANREVLPCTCCANIATGVPFIVEKKGRPYPLWSEQSENGTNCSTISEWQGRAEESIGRRVTANTRCIYWAHLYGFNAYRVRILCLIRFGMAEHDRTAGHTSN